MHEEAEKENSVRVSDFFTQSMPCQCVSRWPTISGHLQQRHTLVLVPEECGGVQNRLRTITRLIKVKCPQYSETQRSRGYSLLRLSSLTYRLQSMAPRRVTRALTRDLLRDPHQRSLGFLS